MAQKLKEPVPEFVGGYVAKMKRTLTEAYDNVQENQETAHQRQSKLYNKKVHGDAYKVGDLVWLHSSVVPPGKSKKLFHPWNGPY